MIRNIYMPALTLVGAVAALAYFAGVAPSSETRAVPLDKVASLESNRYGGPLKYDLKKVREILLTLGYTHIDFADSTPPDYLATACEGRQKVRLGVSQWGEVTSSRVLGKCDQAPIVADAAPDLDLDDVPEEALDTADTTDGDASAPLSSAQGIDVRAPATRVQVTKNRIRVQVPFVDIDIVR